MSYKLVVNQIYNLDALGDKDESITFLGKKVIRSRLQWGQIRTLVGIFSHIHTMICTDFFMLHVTANNK